MALDSREVLSYRSDYIIVGLGLDHLMALLLP